VKRVKELKLKKVQIQIQGDELRVTSPERDALQEVIAFLKGEDFGVELQFGNYRCPTWTGPGTSTRRSWGSP
jgi:cyclic-di-GMP-binding protein